MVASYFKQHKPRSKVLVFDANPEVQSKKALFERAFKQHYEGILEYKPNAELKEVDAATNTARFDFENVQADVLNVVPPQRAADIAKNAGLITVNNRWVGVNWLTMESLAVPGIHVLGDATFSGPGMPKSGHMAHQHRGVRAPVQQRPEGLPAGARLGRRVRHGEPARGAVCALVGGEHLGGHAGVGGFSLAARGLSFVLCARCACCSFSLRESPSGCRPDSRPTFFCVAKRK
jgi:hypothetical protein